MLISDSRQVLFVHVPKTGGVTAEGMMRRSCPDAREDVEPRQGRHSGLGRILRAEPSLADYWVFGFVRNPWARMVSWYSMIDSWNRRMREVEASEGSTDRPKSRGNEMWRAVADYSGFEEFVLRGTAELPRLGKPQISYLRAPRLGREADFIGQTENLASDMQVVLERLGVAPKAPPNRNRSDHGHYRDYYTSETRRCIAEVYAEDIELFGYRY